MTVFRLQIQLHDVRFSKNAIYGLRRKKTVGLAALGGWYSRTFHKLDRAINLGLFDETAPLRSYPTDFVCSTTEDCLDERERFRLILTVKRLSGLANRQDFRRERGRGG